jgi:glycerate kinase
MEMSSASGLALLDPGERDPWRASTFGTGELLLAARASGVDEVWIGIGGSATNEGGAGVAAALGYRFIDVAGGEVDEIPAGLLDAESMFPDLAVDVPEVTVACDVTNPLLGENGATQIYGAQKGVAAADLERVEARLAHIADLVDAELGTDHRESPGAGAAGGLGFGLMSLCDAHLRPGFALVAEATGLEQAIGSADLVITGEGRLDAGSMMGKAPVSLARMAKDLGKPVVAFCGSVDEQSGAPGEFDGVWALVVEGEDPSAAIASPAEALKNRVAQVLTMLEGWAP